LQDRGGEYPSVVSEGCCGKYQQTDYQCSTKTQKEKSDPDIRVIKKRADYATEENNPKQYQAGEKGKGRTTP
jgi:hypothetical protein